MLLRIHYDRYFRDIDSGCAGRTTRGMEDILIVLYMMHCEGNGRDKDSLLHRGHYHRERKAATLYSYFINEIWRGRPDHGSQVTCSANLDDESAKGILYVRNF
ncbi:hypothetical protein CEXT_753391 [Caerostris extrusa]|uniref:Uncharacterized protein n=1 Tax=Caerostris extrusa TaxID=172846 RepID=A0AAV4TGC8_CAEEX|nr:hypothetical protein CEXT_753391 [Caerostris extrusa]